MSCFRKQISGFLSLCTLLTHAAVSAPPPAYSNPFPLDVPEKSGVIDAYHQGRSGKTVFFIQDAHDSIEAQENIAALVRYFTERLGVRTVFEEGYEGPVPTDLFFGRMEDREAKKETARALLENLRIGGAEYAHILRERDFSLIGADDIRLHLENIDWYRKNGARREETEKDLTALRKEILDLTRRYFPKEMKDWMKAKARFDSGSLGLLDYLDRFEKDAVSRCGALSILTAARRGADAGIMERAKDLDAKTIFSEIAALENDLAREHLKDERAEKIFEYYRVLSLLVRLNRIQVTAPEYEAVKNGLDKLETRGLGDFISRHQGRSLLLSRRWEENIRSASKFYETARGRDLAAAERLGSFMKESAEPSAVLVFGGFHKDRMTGLLEEMGFSYYVISPRITKIEPGPRALYRRLMSRGYSPFSAAPILARAARYPPVYVEGLLGAPSRLQFELDKLYSGKKAERDRAAMRTNTARRAERENEISPAARSELRTASPAFPEGTDRRTFLRTVLAGAAALGLPGRTHGFDDFTVRPVPGTHDRILGRLRASLGGITGYLTPEAGIHGPSGTPRDHVQISPLTGKPLGQPADYGAPSKDGIYLLSLFHLYNRNPALSEIKITPEQALDMMFKHLKSLREFQKTGAETEIYGGLYPWHRKLKDGILRLTRFGGKKIVTTLDNAQTTLALASAAGAFWDAAAGSTEAKVRDLALEILGAQDYSKFKSPEGLLYAEWNLDKNEGMGKTGHTTLWTEWAMAVIWAHWTGDISREAWESYASPTILYDTPEGPIDLPHGYVYSLHELWYFQYFPNLLMDSELRPYFKNYAYLIAKHAREKNLPGAPGTEYAPNGVYTAMGIDITDEGHPMTGHVEDEGTASTYTTALLGLIHPPAMEWLAYLFDQPGVIKDFGPVTSFNRRHGPSHWYTADTTFTTVNAVAEWYLKINNLPSPAEEGLLRYFKERYGKSREDLMEAFNLQARKIRKINSEDPDRTRKLAEKGLLHLRDKALHAADREIPAPPRPGDYTAAVPPKEIMPDEVRLSDRLPAGHWHGHSLRVPKEFENWSGNTGQLWTMKDGEIVADYKQTEADLPFLGNPVRAVPIDGAQYISYWLPADLKDEIWELQLRNGDIVMTDPVIVRADKEPAEISPDGKWKRYVEKIRIIEDVKHFPLYYLNYLGIKTLNGEGRIHIRDIRLYKAAPALTAARSELRSHGSEIDRLKRDIAEAEKLLRAHTDTVEIQGENVPSSTVAWRLEYDKRRLIALEEEEARAARLEAERRERLKGEITHAEYLLDSQGGDIDFQGETIPRSLVEWRLEYDRRRLKETEEDSRSELRQQAASRENLREALTLDRDTVFVISAHDMEDLSGPSESGPAQGQWAELLGLKLLNPEKLHIVIIPGSESSPGPRAQELLLGRHFKNVYWDWSPAVPRGAAAIHFISAAKEHLRGSAASEIFDGAFLQALRLSFDPDYLKELTAGGLKPIRGLVLPGIEDLLQSFFEGFVVIARSA